MSSKKESLFLKSLKANPQSIDNSKGFPSLIPIQIQALSQKPLEKNIPPLIINSKPAFLGVSASDYSKISQESNDLLKKMTEDEIQENQKELFETLDPRLLAFFKGKPLSMEKNQEEMKGKEENIEKTQEKEEETKEKSEQIHEKEEKIEKKLENNEKINEKAENPYEKEETPHEKAEKPYEKEENPLAEDKNDYFYNVYFSNEGLEVSKPSSFSDDEEKIEVFRSKQEHTFNNLFAILETFPNNPAIVMFSLYKLSKILEDFLKTLKNTREIIEFRFSEQKELFRMDFIRDLLKNCGFLGLLSRFLAQKSLTVQTNAMKLLRVFLKIVVFDGFSCFIKGNMRNFNGKDEFLLEKSDFHLKIAEDLRNSELLRRIFMAFQNQELHNENISLFLDVLSYISFICYEKPVFSLEVVIIFT